MPRQSVQNLADRSARQVQLKEKTPVKVGEMGPCCPMFSRNLKSAVQYPQVVADKIAKEVALGRDSSRCSYLLNYFCSLMQRFGIPLSSEKTVGPARCLTFLGIELDSVQMVFRLPPDKISHRRPNVWLIGHSYIFWASQRAACRPGGKELGLRDIDVYWRGTRGLVWNQVLLEAMEISRVARPPTILVIHAGGNDLCFLKMAELMTLMRADLERIINFFSEVILVWSELIPRVVWQGARDAEAIERSRRTINCRLSRFVRSKSGVVIRHRQLEGDNRRLMGTDGVHLNEIGLDIFLSGLQDGVEQALLLLRGGRGLV
ncbi:uncharacterized protein ACNLHF_022756 [Anomaloglossus baeobatrachus]